MSFWQRLDISPTTDVKAIKRAYAAQLKLHHPEDDPAGYQALREAFDAALAYAKRGESAAKSESEFSGEPANGGFAGIPAEEPPDQGGPKLPRVVYEPDVHTEEEPEKSPLVPPVRIPPRIPAEDPSEREQGGLRDLEFPEIENEDRLPYIRNCHTVAEFMQRAAEIYDYFPARISRARWLELLNSDVMWNMRSKREITVQLPAFLAERRFLPTEIWELLEASFGLEEMLNEGDGTNGFEPSPAPSFTAYYIRQLRTPALRYEPLLSAEILDIDLYLDYRDKGQQALAENRLETAGRALRQAYALFPDDPDLLLLLGEYELRVGEDRHALARFERRIELAPEEPDGYVQKARTLFFSGRFAEAEDTCRFIIARWPGHTGSKLLLTQSLMHLGREGEALHIYEALYGQAAAFASLPPAAKKRPEPRKTAWTQNRKIKNHALVVLVCLLLIVGLFIYSKSDSVTGAPVPVSSLHQLEDMEPGTLVSLELTDLRDLELGKYTFLTMRDEQVVAYQDANYAFLNPEKYGSADARVYQANFEGKRLAVVSKPFLSENEEGAVKVAGYIDTLGPGKLRDSLAEVLIREASGSREYAEPLSWGSAGAAISGVVSWFTAEDQELAPDWIPRVIEVRNPRGADSIWECMMAIAICVIIGLRSLILGYLEYGRSVRRRIWF